MTEIRHNSCNRVNRDLLGTCTTDNSALDCSYKVADCSFDSYKPISRTEFDNSYTFGNSIYPKEIRKYGKYTSFGVTEKPFWRDKPQNSNSKHRNSSSLARYMRNTKSSAKRNKTKYIKKSSNANKLNHTLNQQLNIFLKRCHSSDTCNRANSRVSKHPSNLISHNFRDVNKLSILKHKELKAGVVFIKNIPPMQSYLENINSYDVYCTWVKMYMVIKTDLRLYIFQNEKREPFLDLMLLNHKFDILPIKFGKQMNYFSLKIYQNNKKCEFIHIGCRTKEQTVSWFQSFVTFVQSLKRQNFVNKATSSNCSNSRKEANEHSENRIDDNSESIFNSTCQQFLENQKQLSLLKEKKFEDNKTSFKCRKLNTVFDAV